jgi:transposase
LSSLRTSPALLDTKLRAIIKLKEVKENMEGIRRTYSEEFKKDAVGHSLTSEKAVAEVAQDLGIAHSNLRRWRAQYLKKRRTGLPRKWQAKAYPARRGDQKVKERAL